MKKNNFLEGAMIATIGIIMCKIIGVLYVIPFYKIIGTKGGTLYSYAYSIYAVFLTLSSTGIPLAISKMVSEYNSLEYYHTKERVYKLGRIIIVGIGFVSFLALIILAPSIAKMIIGDMQGGNTIESITMVIRVISSALLIVPLLSVTKGYLQGHKFITPSSMSQVIEQIIRVLVIIVGSYTAIKVFDLSVDTAVGIAVFGATIGALVAYIYLVSKISKNKNNLNKNMPITREEAKITNKDLIKKIIVYALPFIVIDLVKSAYSLVDTMTVVRTLDLLGKSANYAETTLGVITTWGTKLNMIVISISLGIVVSLIPNIASSYIKKDMKDVNKKVNQSIQALLLITLPMVVGIAFLATPIWNVFYGFDALSINIFRAFIFQALSFSIFTVLINIMQTLNNTKVTFIALLASFIFKVILNIPFMHLCKIINIPLYLGPIIVTLITQFLAIFYIIYVLKRTYKINFKETREVSIKIILTTGIMLMVLMILNLFIDINITSRMLSILYIMLYTFIGVLVYGIIMFKTKTLENVLGSNLINSILTKLHLKK
ncbi:MAG: polysaccharide biosynthesis protein [Firmicutes bacterium]|nr:polysaccharide biosynthesis protein [Bacillota bacterium]